MKKEKKFIIICPCCGKELFKSRIADTEIKCSKCGALLSVEVLDGRIVVNTNIGMEFAKMAEEQSSYKSNK